MLIRNARPADAPTITDIYNHHVLHTVVTFDEEPITAASTVAKIKNVQERLPYLVAEVEGSVVGYAYGGEWKQRKSFLYTTETSIYLGNDFVGQGLGTRLYTELLRQLKDLGFHIAIGGVSLPNPASVRLHEKLGFTPIGTFKEVGWKFQKWIDVGYWQKTL